MESLEIKVQELQTSTSIKFTGDIKGMEAFDLKMYLKKYACLNKNLYLDLSGVNEISLTGLNAFLMAKAYASNHCNEVILVLDEDSKMLHHLHMTKMTSQFKIVFRTPYKMIA